MALQHYTHVIVPVDGSENALRAMDHAGALAAAVDLEVHLVHVAPMSPLEMMKVMGYPVSARDEAGASTAAFEQAREALGDEVLANARARLTAGQRCITVKRPGDPAQMILEYAELLPASMIVMGHRGLSAVRELLMGSVSNRVLHHARCPVTIVP